MGLAFLPPRPAEADACQTLLDEATSLIARGERARDPSFLRKALGLLDRAEQVCPSEPHAPFLAGLTHVLLAEKPQANAAWSRLLGMLRQQSLQQNRPAAEADVDSRVLYLAGLIRLHLDQDPERAEQLLSLVRQRNPAFMTQAVESALYTAVVQVGVRFMRKGEYPPAIRNMRKAALLAGDDAARRDAARRNLAQILRVAHEFSQAEQILVELATAYPRDIVVQYALAGAFADQYKFDEATQVWRLVLRLIDEKADVDARDLPQLGDARLRLGVSLVLGSHKEEGKREIEAYVKAHPDDGRGWYRLGEALMEHFEDFPRAAECLEKALAIDPWCERTLRLLVTLYTIHMPNPERAAKLTNCLETNSARRKAEMDLRMRTRTDALDGCY